MSTSRRMRPRLRPASYRLLMDIDRYIRRYDVRGRGLPYTASDALDGGVNRSDVDELVRRRLLAIVPLAHGRHNVDDLCGTSWTVELSARAIQLLWHERAAR